MSLVLNIAIAVLSVGAWLQMAVIRGNSALPLASRGLASMKYFTVLSNLFSGIVCMVCAVVIVMRLPLFPEWLLALKLAATSAVMLTFLTVIVLLGPWYGWRSMYKGGNLWMHLLLPLMAALDCLLFVPVGSLPVWAVACAMLPTLLYALWYLDVVRRHGAEDGGVVYDFYGFLRWGEDKIALVFVAMLLLSLAIGLCLYLASRALCLT